MVNVNELLVVAYGRKMPRNSGRCGRLALILALGAKPPPLLSAKDEEQNTKWLGALDTQASPRLVRP